MRRAALIVALVCAPLLVSGAQAEGSRESRYGPAPERAPTPASARAAGYTGQAYTGRTLGWSGKREMAPQAARTAAEAQQPWWARSAPQAPQAPQASRARPAYQPPVPADAAPARELPQSIYDAPRSAAQDAHQYAPVPAAYAAPVQPAYRPQQQATLQPGQIGARTYSVGRQFGMTPDAIPAAGPPRMVLIAPPATAPEDDDKDKPQGDGDWSAKPQKDDQ
jgi:hypothetical protein